MNPYTLALRSKGFSPEEAARLLPRFEGLDEAAGLELLRSLHPEAAPHAAPAPPAEPVLDEAARSAALAEGRRQEAARATTINGIFAPYLERSGTIQVGDQPATRTGAQLLKAAIADPDFTPDAARAQALELLAGGDAQRNLGRPSISIGTDERDHARANIEASILSRATSTAGIVLTEDEQKRANEYGRRSLVEAARSCLVAAGVKPAETFRMSNQQIVGSAFTSRMPDGRALAGGSTSDFPSILENIANKALMGGFAQSAATYRQWCYIDSVSDFKSKSLLNLSNLTTFDVVPEGDDFPLVTLTEQKETVQAVTRGAIIRFTRQAVINDDLGAFTRAPMLMGMAANRTINKAAVTTLLLNEAMAYDSVAMFHADHANLLTTSAYAPTTTAKAKLALNKLKNQMRLQTGLEGEILDLQPEIVLCGPTAEDYVLEALSDVTSTEESRTPNRGIRGLTAVVEPQLENTNISGNSATALHVFANQMIAPGIVVAFLDGQEGPYLERRNDFDSDGFDTKVRNDFGVGKNDHRGIQKSTGV